MGTNLSKTELESILSKIDLDTTELDDTLKNLTEEEFEKLYNSEGEIIIGIWPNIREVTLNLPNSYILSTGKNWVVIDYLHEDNNNNLNHVWNILEDLPCGAPVFDHGMNINEFRNIKEFSNPLFRN